MGKLKTPLSLCIVLAMVLSSCTKPSATPSPSTVPAEQTQLVLTIGEEKIYMPEFNYHYFKSVYDELDYFELNEFEPEFDIEEPLSEQIYDQETNESYQDYFTDIAKSNLIQIVAKWTAAKSAGITLTADDNNAIAEDLAAEQLAVDMLGVSYDEFTQSYYGKGVTKETLQKTLERVYLADRYEKTIREGYNRTDEQLESYYNASKENKDYTDYFDYHYFDGFSKTPEESEDGETTTKTVNAATYKSEQKQKAEKMLSEVTLDNFFEKVVENSDYTEEEAAEELEYYAEDPEYDDTLQKGVDADGIGAEEYDFMTDKKRKPGDKILVETEDAYVVVMFVKRYRPENRILRVRHILAAFYPDEGDPYSSSYDYSDISGSDISGSDIEESGDDIEEEEIEEETVPEDIKASTKATAEAILAEWQAGTKTEDSFAKLATKRSSDDSAQEGGLIEDVNEDYEPAFAEWALDPARQYGDTGIVETFFGYHVMYYIGYGAPHWKEIAEEYMNNEEFLGKMEELQEPLTVTEDKAGLALSRTRVEVQVPEDETDE